MTMRQSVLFLVTLGVCIFSVSSTPVQPDPELAKSEGSVPRSGWGWGASEFFSGPPAVFFALPLAIGLICLLWIAAYNTLRSPPPKIGFGGGAQGGGGWGGWGTGWGGWPAPAEGAGWPAASTNYAAYDVAASASGSSPQAATVASAVQQTVEATGQRSLNDLTHRVLTSIERGIQAQRK